MTKAVLDDPETQKARLVLSRAYGRLRGRKSWARVAARYGLTKGRAFDIANGRRAVNPDSDLVLMRAILRESEAARAPVKMRRQIRRIAVPFLDARQRSAGRVYGPGGRPVSRALWGR